MTTAVQSAHGLPGAMFLGNVMKPLLFAAFSLVAALCLSSTASAQMGPPPPLAAEVLVDAPAPEVVDWLSGRIVAQGPVTGGLTFEFPQDFYQNQLFLLAESHGSAAPQIMDYELLAHLNARIGLRDYVAEVDPVQGERLNHYLETGDEAALKEVFDFWTRTGAQWGNKTFEDKVRRIRALNLTLPEDRRIRFIGIDAVQDWALTRSRIEALGGAIDPAAWDAADAKAKSTLVLGALEGHASGPAGQRLTNLLRRQAAGADRETVIFETYSEAVRSGELGERPAYGLWGMFHAMQGTVSGAEPFAARVRTSELSSSQKVATVALLSLDSAIQIPVPLHDRYQRLRLTDFNIDGPYVKVQGSATLRAASKPDAFVIFDIEADPSPLKPGDFLTIRTAMGQNFALKDDLPSSTYARYLGVLRGSDWAPPRD